MALSFLASLLLSVSVLAADSSCHDDVQRKQDQVDQIQKRYDEGQASLVELLDVKIVLADAMYKCGPFVKIRYCAYKQNLLNAKIGHLDAGPVQDAAKKDLETFRAFCLDPKQ